MTKEIEQSWTEFLCALCDKEDESILTQISCPLLEFFDKQVNIDRARKALFKKELNKVFRLYLGRIDLYDLSDKMNQHRKNFILGFGPDRFNHLKLLVRLKILEQEKKPKKGLLAG